MNPKEKLILKFLKKNGKSSTSRISVGIKSDYYITFRYLEGLEKEGKVNREKKFNSTFWGLKK